MWNNQIAQRAVSLVGMVVKIRAPNQSKADPKVSFFLVLNYGNVIIKEMVDNAVDTGPVYFGGDELEMGFRIDRLGDIGLNS